MFFAVAVVFATMLRFEPIYDLEAIYRGGEGWGIYGELMRFTSHTFDPNYFYRWHNNLGGAAVSRHLFQAGACPWAAQICFWLHPV